MVVKWVSVKERFPKENEYCLVLKNKEVWHAICLFKNGKFVYSDKIDEEVDNDYYEQWSIKEKRFVIFKTKEENKISHWTLLPGFEE